MVPFDDEFPTFDLDGPMFRGKDPDDNETNRFVVRIQRKKAQSDPALWIKKDGTIVRIADMATPHIENAVALLERNLAKWQDLTVNEIREMVDQLDCWAQILFSDFYERITVGLLVRRKYADDKAKHLRHELSRRRDMSSYV